MITSGLHKCDSINLNFAEIYVGYNALPKSVHTAHLCLSPQRRQRMLVANTAHNTHSSLNTYGEL